MIENQLSSAGSEQLEVGVCSVQGLRGSLIGCLQVHINVECLVVPIGLLQYKVGKESVAEKRHETLHGRRAGDPESPAAFALFGTGQIAGENDVPLGIKRSRVEFLQRGDLRYRQAFV